MFQAHATYKPGDRPKSYFGTAVGCLAKQMVFLLLSTRKVRRCHFFQYARVAQRTTCKKFSTVH